jgi:nucleosome assembly protein 1-like 1
VKKTVPQDSFFRFFTPPTLSEEDEEAEDEDEADEQHQSLEDKIDMDFEIGEVIKSKIIPRGVDWFTGEALEYEDDGGYMDDDDEVLTEKITWHNPNKIYISSSSSSLVWRG